MAQASGQENHTSGGDVRVSVLVAVFVPRLPSEASFLLIINIIIRNCVPCPRYPTLLPCRILSRSLCLPPDARFPWLCIHNARGFPHLDSHLYLMLKEAKQAPDDNKVAVAQAGAIPPLVALLTSNPLGVDTSPTAVRSPFPRVPGAECPPRGRPILSDAESSFELLHRKSVKIEG